MIKIAIAGYGSVGRGVEYAIEQNKDMELVSIFTRRSVSSIKPRTNISVVSMDEAAQWADKVDVLILCGGSFADLPTQGPELARYFNTIDSFDTHPIIPQYFADMDAALKASGKLGIIAVGWDPGLFSLNRLYMSAVLPDGESYTFFGRGISQGHSNAIRQIDGVLDAIQYTCPIESAVEKVRSGSMPKLSASEKHFRECYVVLKDGANAERVKYEIVNMPYYFAGSTVHVHFISLDEFKRNHSDASNKGFVFRNGHTGQGKVHQMDYSLKLDSNAEFTATVLVAYARAAYRMALEGKKGAVTVFDVPPALLSTKSSDQLRAEML
jgi:diaminopimelate dehydrogenase